MRIVRLPDLYRVHIALLGLLFTLALSNAESSPYLYLDAPSDIVLNSTVIRENRDPGGGGIGVGDFVDDEGNAIDYELVTGEGDDNNAAFRIVKKANNSQLQAIQIFDFEEKNTYSIRVRATLDGSIEKTFTIDVTNEEESPTDIILSSNSVDQDASEGDEVGAFSVTGGAPVPISYNLLDDANEAFVVDGNMLKIGDGFDGEDQTSYTIEVQAVGDGSFTKFFTITVNEPANQLPTADAGLDQTLTDEDGNGSELVTLDGSKSGDDFGITSYVWTESSSQLATGVTPSVNLSVGEHTLTLTVTDEENESDTDDVKVTVNAPANQPPIANAGTDQNIVDSDRDGSETFKLNGSASSDPDGTITSFRWRKNDNNGELLAEGEQPTVVMPVGDNLIALVVEDDDQATASDAVMIYIDSPPLANAGSDQTVTDEDGNGKATVTLDGSASSDADGTIESYAWSWADGGSASGEQPSVDLDIGTYLITLEVTDNDGIKHSDDTSVRVEAPQASNIRLNGNTVAENEPAGTLVGTLDADGTGIVYKLLSGNDNFRLDENDDNRLLTNRVFDFEEQASAEYQVEIEACNRVLGIEYGCTKSTFTITIENIEEPPPDFDLSSTSILENRPVGTGIGDFPDDGGAIDYSLVSGNGDEDNASFKIVKKANNSQLQSNEVFDFEAKKSYSIRVRADNGDGTRDKEFEITIRDEAENQPPTADAGSDQTIVDEDRDGEVQVRLDASASSDDEGITTYAWSWADGVSAAGVNPDVTLPVGQTTITLTVTDGEGASDTDEVKITVNAPANEAPVANAGVDQTLTDNDGNGSEMVTLDGSGSSDDFGITSYSWSWAEGGSAAGENPEVSLPVGETTITLTVEDEEGETDTDQVKITINEQPNELPTADAGLDQTLTDEDGDGSELVTLDGTASTDADGTIESYAWSWANGGSASGEQPTVELPTGQTTITLTVTDDKGGADTDEVKIRIDEPDAPVISLTSSEVLENQEKNTLVGQFESESPISLSYSLPNNPADNRFFKINDGNKLVTDAVFDRETKDNYTIEVLASYAVGSVKQEFTITILNEIETPTNITLSNTTVAENQADITVGNLQTEGGQGPYTYTLTGNNNDNNLFTIEGSQLKTKGALDFENKNSLVVEVTSANDGSITKKFTIEVTNVEEPPTDIVLSSASVNENEPKNTLVGEFTVEGGGVANPNLQFADGNNDNNLFKLDGKRLRTNAVFDREEESSYKVRVRAVGDGSFAKDFTINITNVNDAPQISITEDQILFAEGDDPVKILSDITVSDVDNTSMSSATLTIFRNYVQGEDELITDVDHQWNNNQGKLTINGPITIAELQKALRDVQYKNNKSINPTSSAREVRVVVNDGALDSNTERISVLVDNPNVPPSLTDFELEVSEDQVLTFNASDFEANYEDADNNFPNQIYIASVPAEGVLTIDGEIITSAVILDRRPEEEGYLVDFSEIDSFTYTPFEDFNGSDKFRWNISDGSNYGNEAEVLINVIPVNDAPTIVAPSQLSAQENQPLELTSITFSDIDDDVLSLTLAVSDGFLVINPAIASSVSVLNEEDGGAKRVQATGTATELTTLLEGITYANQSPDEGDELRIVLNDSPDNAQGAFTAETTVAIVINPNNDPPVLSAIEETTLVYEENSDPLPITQTLEVADEEQNAILAATLTILNAEDGDTLVFTDTEEIQSSNTGDTLVLTGEASVEAYQAAIRTVQFVSSNDNPSAAARLIEIQVTDANQGMSNILARAVTISAVDDTTEIAQVAEETFYILGSEEIPLFSNGVIIDPDDETLSSLVIQFEDGSYVPEFDSLAIPIGTELSVEWNEEDGILTITGESSLADYQSLLRSILYRYKGTEEAEKMLSVVITTNRGVTSRVSQQIRIVLNQPPQIADITLDLVSGQERMFSADDFLSAYSDPDNFPTTGGFAAIRIVSLPVAGQLKLGQEVIGEDQLGDTGLLISRENISALSYVMPTNETAADQFAWNATDGAEFAEENAVVAIKIQLLSVSLSSDSDEVCRGLSLNLTATLEGGVAPFTYEWTCNEVNCGIVGNSEQIEITPIESSDYKVIVTDANGIQTSKTIFISVSACDLVIPTGFTPNGDNINDTWELQNINTFEQKLVEVYNRYGHRVFFSDTYNSAWDGTHNGKVLPAGTYYYRIEVGEEAKRYQGQVTILQ